MNKNTPEQIKAEQIKAEQIRAYKRKVAMFKRCATGKPVNCDKCIGCTPNNH